MAIVNAHNGTEKMTTNANNEYAAKQKHIAELLASIRIGVEEHDSTDRNKHHGDVADLGRFEMALQELDDQINQKGEYARPYGG